MKDVAQFLKILADESRLQILWLLINHDELCVCDLGEAIGASQSKVSRHLATLRHTGLVTDRKEGAWTFYSLCPANTELERAVLDALRERLGDHPSAMRVLQSLHDWIDSQTRDVSCGPSCSPKSPCKTAGRSTERRGRGGAQTRTAEVKA